MNKLVLIFTVLLGSVTLQAQNNLRWQGYFSYNSIRDIAESPNSLVAASENALFTCNLNTNELKTINTIDGLKSDEITAVFKASNGQVFIGNQNGLLLIVNANNTITTRNGIVEEVPVAPFIKQINHFTESNGKLYLSCDYGISVFDLISQEFADTYFIGNNGNAVKVLQTTLFNNQIYAVTETQGIKCASISNPNLVDYSVWLTFNSDFWKTINTINSQIIAANNNGRLYRFEGNNAIEFGTIGAVAIDGRVHEDVAIFTTPNSVWVYNSLLQQTFFFQTNQVTEFAVTFSCATVINGILYIGTKQEGIIAVSLDNPTQYNFKKPNGPVSNAIFRARKGALALYLLYGSYSRGYNPYNPSLGEFPINKFTAAEGWTILPYIDLFGAKSLSNIAFQPNKPKDFFVTSYFSGVLKVENNVPTQLFDKTNTGANGIESLIDPSQPGVITNDQRINGGAFDKEGNLWITNSFVAKALKVLRTNNQWQSYDISQVISESLTESYGLLVVDKNNTKWLPSQRNGLIAYNETINKSSVISNDVEGNLPSTDVRCLAIDNRNQLWIGTGNGLRILSSVDQFLSEDQLKSRSIIIEENGLAQELFFQQFILDIAVDGANRKWVSTAEGGVFLVSPNGQETIFQFTKENSPLPSNTINDIEIDPVSGEVFFVSDKGMVSFKGTSTAPSDSLANAYAYPNPVRPNFIGTVKITNLTTKAIIKITDIEGNLVHETTSEGGTIEWDTTAFGKYKVASGVYLILISSQDGTDTTVKKLMIVR